MAIEMVRIPSETPNISNTDDFVGLRYAYGNQNGYVIGKGQECSYTINGSKFRVNSGRLVLQGVECDIDANGVEITIDNVATKKYYTVYLQVNLGANETKILAMSDTSSYPTIESGNDLTQSTTGTATMELYHFEATSGVISNVQKLVQKIDYTGTALVGYDISKGTVEERLDALGFKQSTITNKNWVIGRQPWLNQQPYTSENSLQRQGNYVNLRLNIPRFDNYSPKRQQVYVFTERDSKGYHEVIATVPENFRPKTNIINDMCVLVEFTSSSEQAYEMATVEITTDGNIVVNTTAYQIQGIAIYCGYEANPL